MKVSSLTHFLIHGKSENSAAEDDICADMLLLAPTLKHLCFF